MSINKFKVNEEGLNRFFGALEAKIMEVIWAAGEQNIKQVQEKLSLESPISFNAVNTVMNRLVDKEHLSRHTKGRTTYYHAVQSKEEFLHEQTKSVTLGLIEDFGGLVASHFVEALEQVDTSFLQQLEDKLNELKKRNENNGS
ncbi:BlaI/MecI/CopY family transcriptional regulator [Paenibacillus sedimenti]|uniref:BlaI/MecI/CopY family transcriptional regulator n=1 Tax=Paenibacillus sedimenti TaxID=2770274 RepID=A0A926KS99_9BACL|nr:BlaI/MecI/CopY family transcriptional regulator [Paenibacillus sedimenti]MBD0383164.1 BlaI/MecI/CopY family transcriptional regulator [Paenibacillus sedimenti]